MMRFKEFLRENWYDEQDRDDVWVEKKKKKKKKETEGGAGASYSPDVPNKYQNIGSSSAGVML